MKSYFFYFLSVLLFLSRFIVLFLSRSHPPLLSSPLLSTPLISSPLLFSLFFNFFQLAQVFIFQPPSEVRLVNRLKTIAALEGLYVTGDRTYHHSIFFLVYPVWFLFCHSFASLLVFVFWFLISVLHNWFPPKWLRFVFVNKVNLLLAYLMSAFPFPFPLPLLHLHLLLLLLLLHRLHHLFLNFFSSFLSVLPLFSYWKWHQISHEYVTICCRTYAECSS